MENISSLEINKIDANLEKIGDFLYHEGPLLSLYQDKDNKANYYFYKWADCDNECNRWLIFSVTEENLRRFLFEEFSLYELIAKNQLLFLVDLNNNFVQKKCLVVRFNDLPSNYLPSENSFYKDENYTNLARSYKYAIFNNKTITLNFVLEEIEKIKEEQKAETKIMNKILALLSDKNAKENTRKSRKAQVVSNTRPLTTVETTK